MDIFTFGLLIFYCLSGGQHPFGEGIERDYRILNVRRYPCKQILLIASDPLIWKARILLVMLYLLREMQCKLSLAINAKMCLDRRLNVSKRQG